MHSWVTFVGWSSLTFESADKSIMVDIDPPVRAFTDNRLPDIWSETIGLRLTATPWSHSPNLSVRNSIRNRLKRQDKETLVNTFQPVSPLHIVRTQLQWVTEQDRSELISVDNDRCRSPFTPEVTQQTFLDIPECALMHLSIRHARCLFRFLDLRGR